MMKLLRLSQTIGTASTTVTKGRVVRTINISANAVLVMQSYPVTNTEIGRLVLAAADQAIIAA
jgi:hypothetical protein